MALVRIDKEIIPESTRETEIRECDICGGDATNLVGCHECKKDLCRPHQIDTSGIRNFKADSYSVDKEITGNVYCRPCLLKKISQTFPG